MAYRRKTTRRTARKAPARRSSSKRSYTARASRAKRRVRSRAPGRPQTVRLEIVQAPAPSVSPIAGIKPEVTVPKKAKF